MDINTVGNLKSKYPKLYSLLVAEAAIQGKTLVFSQTISAALDWARSSQRHRFWSEINRNIYNNVPSELLSKMEDPIQCEGYVLIKNGLFNG